MEDLFDCICCTHASFTYTLQDCVHRIERVCVHGNPCASLWLTDVFLIVFSDNCGTDRKYIRL